MDKHLAYSVVVGHTERGTPIYAPICGCGWRGAESPDRRFADACAAGHEGR